MGVLTALDLYSRLCIFMSSLFIGTPVYAGTPLRALVDKTKAPRPIHQSAHVGERPTEKVKANMAKNNTKDTQVVYRDSKTGEFLTQRQAERKDPATWEREHVHHPKK
jgi:hypothetical protein